MANMPRAATQYQKRLMKDIERTDHNYDYPRDLNWKPGSDLHEWVVDELLARARASEQPKTDAIKNWKRMDWTLSAYMPANEAEQAIKAKDFRKPVTVVIPMTFASMETLITYMTSVFLQDPIHLYKAHGGKKDIISAAKLQLAVRQQSLWFKEGRRLQTQFRDMFAYGFGAISPMWRKHKTTNPIIEEVGDALAELFEGTPLEANKGDLIRYFEESTLFEGSDCINIDPYNILLDPSTPIDRYQESNWIGWVDRGHIYDRLSRESDPEEHMFNYRYVEMLVAQGAAHSVHWKDNDSGRNDQHGIFDTVTGRRDDRTTQTDKDVHEVVLFVNLIPAEWGLGDRKTPQKWMFRLAGDRIITQAEPINFHHGMFPICIGAPNSTGYDVYPVSHLQTTYGLQQAIDFQINMDNANQRKALNDMLIVDPSMVELEDLRNPEPGKLIRLKQPMFGQVNLNTVVQQLQVTDLTANNYQRAGLLTEFFRQANGTVDIAMGDLSNMPERPTARGINAAQTGALSRLQTLARAFSMQSMQDLGWQKAFNTMQFMSQEIVTSIIGPHEANLRQEFGLQDDQSAITISPFDFTPNFTVTPRDGSLPSLNDPEAMMGALMPLLQVPEIAQSLYGQLDLPRMFLQALRKTGFDDVHEFRIPEANALVGGDALVQQQAQAGNLVPIGGVQ